jgi:hypothetical protein
MAQLTERNRHLSSAVDLEYHALVNLERVMDDGPLEDEVSTMSRLLGVVIGCVSMSSGSDGTPAVSPLPPEKTIVCCPEGRKIPPTTRRGIKALSDVEG